MCGWAADGTARRCQQGRGSPAGRPGPCEGRAARGQARTLGTRLRLDTPPPPCVPSAQSTVCSSRQLSLPTCGFTPLPPSAPGQTPLSTAGAHPSLQRLPTLPEFSTSAGSTCDLRWSPHHSRKRWLISSETCARSGPRAFPWRRFRGGELGTEGWCP